MSRKPKLDRALDWAIGIALVLAVALASFVLSAFAMGDPLWLN